MPSIKADGYATCGFEKDKTKAFQLYLASLKELYCIEGGDLFKSLMAL